MSQQKYEPVMSCVMEICGMNWLLTAAIEYSVVEYQMKYISGDYYNHYYSHWAPYVAEKRLPDFVNPKSVENTPPPLWESTRLLSDKYVANSMARFILNWTEDGEYGRSVREINIKKKRAATISKTITARFLKAVWRWVEQTADPKILAIQKKANTLLGSRGAFNEYWPYHIYETYWAEDALRMNSAHYWLTSGTTQSRLPTRRGYMSFSDDKVKEVTEQDILQEMKMFNEWQSYMYLSSKTERRIFSKIGRFRGDIVKLFHDVTFIKEITWWPWLELLYQCDSGVHYHRLRRTWLQNFSKEEIKSALLIASEGAMQPIRDWRVQQDVRAAIEWFSHHLGWIERYWHQSHDLPAAVRSAVDEFLIRERARWHEDMDLISIPHDEEYPSPEFVMPAQLADAKWLRCGNDLLVEAKNMAHCIATYHTKCANARYFAWHFVHRGEECTIGVYPSGQVDQIRGPRNRDNAATAYAWRIVRKLGGYLPLKAIERR